jgi:acetate kinase
VPRRDGQSRAVLTINAGSSSVKCALFSMDVEPRALARATIEHTAIDALPRLFEWIAAGTSGGVSLSAIGHRIVHGGPSYRQPQWMTNALAAALEALSPFAPNHLPDELALVRALAERWNGIPQLACFDTAFHRDLPEVAWRLPLPQDYSRRGIRRYGFHGLSYAFLMEELARTAAGEARERVILAHLGNGSSLTAVHDGRSVDTTMGFTPISGVVMSTRSGDLDPGVVTYLARTEGLSADRLDDFLSHRSGLLAISGVSSDMRTLLEREEHDAACRLAVDMYTYGIRKAVGALAAALGGLDTLVFSGGIGEHAPAIRARIADGLAFLGIEIDSRANTANSSVISSRASRVRVRVIATDEELMIARTACHMLATGPSA